MSEINVGLLLKVAFHVSGGAYGGEDVTTRSWQPGANKVDS